MQALNPTIFIFGENISLYLVLHLLGIAISFFTSLWAAGKLEIERRHIFRLYPWMVYGGFLFAHFYFLATEPHENNQKFMAIFKGLSAPGAVIGVVLSIVIYSRIAKISTLLLMDLFMPALAIVLGLGRLGCFALGCCYGKPTAFWLNVTYWHERVIAPRGIPLHPVQMYEFILTTALAAWLYSQFFRKSSKYQIGDVTTLFLFGYAAERFVTAFLRGDAPPIFGIFVHYHVMGLILALISIGLRRVCEIRPTIPFLSKLGKT